jgi:glycerate dehydrogenase
MKIVFLDLATIGQDLDISCLKKFGNLVVFPTTENNEIINRVHDAEIIVTSKCQIDEAVLMACKNLRLICIAATGMNNVNLIYARKIGVTVLNVQGYSTFSVSQTVFSLIFRLISNINLFEKFIHEGIYSNNVIGIIGFGRIGQKVASIAKAFEMQVVYYSTTGENKKDDYSAFALEELLSNSDIISIHCPLNEKTKNLINWQNLNLMKQTSILINTARGGIVNEIDLISALENKIIAGAALDVFLTEPIPKNHPLLDYRGSNLILTPHIAWSSLEAKQKLIKGVCENIYIFLNQNLE